MDKEGNDKRSVKLGDKSIYVEDGNVSIVYSAKEIPKYLGSPVFHSDVFTGRDDELKVVRQKLFEGENQLLLVNGEGGIGKTTLAARYYRKHTDQYIHLVWVFVEKNLADALLMLASPLGVTFPDQMPAEERLALLLDAMRQLEKPCLLVIDNVNDANELKKYYNALRSCLNFHLLLTTRITEFEHAETCKIGPLSDDEAGELFKKYYPRHLESENQLLNDILAAVGKNTLVIALLAKNLYNFNRLKTRYSLNDLLHDLKDKGLFGLQTKEVSTSYHTKGNALREESPEAIISAMYDLSDLSVAERQMLSVFAVLPAENITFAQIETLLPGFESLDNTVLSLAQKGWLDYNEQQNALKISPVVQEITQVKNIHLRDDCRQLIRILTDKLDYEPGTGQFINATYTEAKIYSRYAESILHCIKQAENDLAILSERVGNYHRTTGNPDKALTFI